MLGKYGQLHLYPVHPLTLAKYRETWYPSRSKDDIDDIKDANLLLEILTRHRGRLRRLDPDTAECLASTTFPGQRQLFLPTDDNYKLYELVIPF